MNANIFREYDIRGIVEKDLDAAVYEDLGRGLGTFVRRAHGTTIVVGRDARLTGPRFSEALIEGVRSTGVGVIDIGVVPTPVVYFAANTLPVDGLAVITGSHNPPEYNGLKSGVGKTTFFGETIQELRKLIERKDFVKGERKGTLETFDALTPYLHFVASSVRRGSRKLKVVIDAGNGVGGLSAVPLLTRLGYEVIPLFCEPDGNFPNHHADPTVAKNLEAIIAEVKKRGADLGVAFDGDADRIGVVDEKGGIIWGDRLMVILARAILKAVPGATIIGEVKCSSSMYDDIARHGGKGVMWKTGHSLIKAKMKETHAMLAGEMSGHIFYKHRYYGYDDATYTAARLLELLSEQNAPLSSLLADLPVTFASPELKIDTQEDKKFRLVELCAKALRAKGLDLIEVDGVRATWPDGWGLIRASNTTPVLVVRYEARTEARMEEIRVLLTETINQAKRELGELTLAVGFDIGGTNARGALVRDGDDVVAMGRATLTERSPAAVVEVVAKLCAELGAGSARHVGVGLAAMLDNGRVRNAPNLGWRDVDFGALLSARLQAPVLLVNDLTAVAWGEHRRGASRGVADSFTVFVGTGVGSAMILRGAPYRGSRGLGGELGHVKVVARGGRPCGCGSSGCLEAYAGGANLATWMAEKGLSGGAGELERYADEGNPAARELFEFVSDALATAIANQVSVLNPARVVLGGGVLARAPRLRKFLIDHIPKLAVEPTREGLEVVSAELGDDAGAIGAALLAQRQP